MVLDYAKLTLDKDGNPEEPALVLKTMGEETIGVIPGVSGLKLHIKFSEPSVMTFDVAAVIDGKPNWIYSLLTGYKLIYTKGYGIYVTVNPERESDGVLDVKHIEAYSIEYVLNTKKFFIEEGTFRFYDQTNPKNPDTVVGRLLEAAAGWGVGYVSPSLAQRYRTFDRYDDFLLPFMYGTAKEKYRCVFVFDPYKRTFSAYDADEAVRPLPIYLDFDNLVTQLSVEELSDELVTALRPYGADELDIRAVNPIGTNWLYDLSFFISEGDIAGALAEKWTAWQRSIRNNREYYKGLTALRASATARLLAAKAALTDLKGELDSLRGQQSVTIQALALETTEDGRAYQQRLLDELNRQIREKETEYNEQQEAIRELEALLDPEEPDSYAARIVKLTGELAFEAYFTKDEQEKLSKFFIEQDLTDETFVATDVDTAVSGASYALEGGSVAAEGSRMTRVELAEYGKRMYTMAGGTISLQGGTALTGDIIRGTLEAGEDGTFVLSAYAGTIRAGESTAQSGMITVSGRLSGFEDDIGPVTEEGITTYEGTRLNFSVSEGSLYLTANVSDYQKYSVQTELLEFAEDALREAATPTYEFSVDSGNFIFAKEFAPFRDKLELGRGVYLNVGDRRVITPYIIEFELDFEDRSAFSLVFSNRFKRYDNVNTLRDMVEKSYSYSRSFDASRHIYNKTAGQASAVSDFMAGSLDAARNTIIGASNQSVVIDGAGIQVGGDSRYQLRVVDKMIAMTDDGWDTAKLAIGLFAAPEVGEYWGVNADVVGGRLLIGNNLILENPLVDEHNNPTGVMQFKVDSTGAWLNNATFLLQKDGGGKLLLDPRYGIVAGTGDIYSTNGTTVTPSFVDEQGYPVLDDDGMPKNANFYLDLRDGSAYFRGSGAFKGIVRARDFISDLTGESMFNGSGQLKEGYLELTDVNGRITSVEVDAGKISARVEEVAAKASEDLSKFTTEMLSLTGNLQAQIDGQVETHYYDYEPSLFNAPASGWTTEEERQKHEGDLFFDRGTGYAYRFLKENGKWKWQMIQDTDITKAIKAAAAAQDTADHKRRVFTATPTPPYDVGDLWAQGPDGELMRCRTARSGGSFVESDWEKAGKYTDDSALNTFLIGQYKTDLDGIRTQADQKAETWYQDADPSTAWTSAEAKAEHKGDMWYCTGSGDTTHYQKFWRWSGSGWQETTSTPPEEVFDSIDGKAQIFISQPKPPYRQGDLWFNSDTSDILTCVQERLSGDYAAGDWEKRNKYTDDTYAANKYSELDLRINSIKLEVANGDTKSSLTLKAGETVLSSADITLDGVVTFEGLRSGTTVIDGGWISTENLNLTGKITWGDLNSTVQSNINNRGVSAATVHTLIEQDLVASPKIKGGEFWDLNDTGRLTLSTSFSGNTPIPHLKFTRADGRTLFSVYDGDLGTAISGSNNNFSMIIGESATQARGTWDFSMATVTGLRIA